MKILQVLPYLEGNGTERHALLLARYFKEIGHQVSLAAPAGPMETAFASLGVPMAPIPALTLGSFGPAMRRLASAAADADLVHIHAAQEICGGLRMAGCRKPLIFTAHCYHHAIDYAKAGLFLNPFCDRVIGVSEAERRRLAQAGTRRLSVVLNGIDQEPFEGFDRVAVRLQLSLPADAVVAIAVGRLVRPKGLEIFLRALKGTGREVRALIVGDGPEAIPLKAIAAAFGLDDRVKFLGRREDLPRLLAAADLYVSPTRREGLSLAALEAMASGLPLVVSDLPEFAEIVRTGENGLTFPVGQPESLAQALTLLAGMPEMRRTMAEASKTRMARFDWRRMGDETLSVYRLALGQSAHGHPSAQRGEEDAPVSTFE